MRISKTISLLCIGILLGVLGMGIYGRMLLTSLVADVEQSQQELTTTFIRLAEQADRIEQIPEITAHVSDCAERARFETLLTSLPLRTTAEQHELDVLFAQCADYYVRLKEYYAQELTSITARYERNLILWSHIFAPHATWAAQHERLATVSREEHARATLMRAQVALQHELIGAHARRKEARPVKNITEDGQNVGGKLSEINITIDTTRSQIQEHATE
jgi:hypothetical protein